MSRCKRVFKRFAWRSVNRRLGRCAGVPSYKLRVGAAIASIRAYATTLSKPGTTARSFLDEVPGPAGDATRTIVAETLIDFLRGHVLDDPAALARIADLVADPPAEVARAARRTTTVDTSPAEALVSATVGED